MSFTFGFYNSIEHDRLYDAIQVSKIFDGIILDGVYETIGDAFIVQASTEANLVTVGPGRAWFNHTWNDNNGYLDVELDPPETVLARIDAIVIDVDERVTSRKNDILVVKGTPSGTPAKPTLTNVAEHHQYPLAYVTRDAATNVITQAKIENAVGTSACPFVTGVLDGIDTDLLLLEWKAAWGEFLEACQDNIDEWEDAAKADVATFVAAFKTQLNEFVTQTATWQTAQKQSFEQFYNEFKQGSIIYMKEYTDWVESLKDILEEDAVGNLLLKIQEIQDEVNTNVAQIHGYMKELVSGFQSKLTTFETNGNIVETYPDGSKITTVFSTDGKVITATLTSASGEVGAVLKTTFKDDGSIEEKVTGGDFQEFMLSKDTGVGTYINNQFGLNTPAMDTLGSMEDVMGSATAVNAILGSDTAWNGLKNSNITMTTMLKSSVAATCLIAADASRLKYCLETRWDETLVNLVILGYIIDTRSILLYIFNDATMRPKFLDNVIAITALTTESTLIQQCFFGSSAGEVKKNWVIKDHGVGHEAWDIHEYTWSIFFDHIYEASPSNPGEEADYIEFHPMGTAELVYNWVFDSSEQVDILSPILVDIANGAYGLYTRRFIESGAVADTNPAGVMASCVAF